MTSQWLTEDGRPVLLQPKVLAQCATVCCSDLWCRLENGTTYEQSGWVSTPGHRDRCTWGPWKWRAFLDTRCAGGAWRLEWPRPSGSLTPEILKSGRGRRWGCSGSNMACKERNEKANSLNGWEPGRLRPLLSGLLSSSTSWFNHRSFSSRSQPGLSKRVKDLSF